jgi:hypothetical protein
MALAWVIRKYFFLFFFRSLPVPDRIIILSGTNGMLSFLDALM